MNQYVGELDSRLLGYVNVDKGNFVEKEEIEKVPLKEAQSDQRVRMITSGHRKYFLRPKIWQI